MASKHLQKESIEIQDRDGVSAWYYEESGGLTVVIEDNLSPTLSVKLPWRQIRKSLERKDRKP